jgi:hypothetical protein
MGLIPDSQTLTWRIAAVSAEGTEDFTSVPGNFGCRFTRLD